MATSWLHVPKQGRKIARMFPLKYINKLRISLVLEGCTNRPFYTIQVKSNLDKCSAQGIEQIGSWDPLPNAHGEQLVGINIERLLYWMSKGAQPNKMVSQILGIGGILPVHPRSFLHPMRIKREEALKESSDGVIDDPVLKQRKPKGDFGLGFKLKENQND